MILSRGMLLKIRNGLPTCLKNLITEHEDIEIGRLMFPNEFFKINFRNLYLVT